MFNAPQDNCLLYQHILNIYFRAVFFIMYVEIYQTEKKKKNHVVVLCRNIFISYIFYVLILFLIIF